MNEYRDDILGVFLLCGIAFILAFVVLGGLQ